ncbi:hypothetical protein [Catenulispora subtropica]|uniref:Uncharacterized protein n=1 Tax=Catenulispora subtropica TaxID=450798 RepID=A0ABP5E373_9ACTN
MADVKVRVTAGIGAWFIGATTATCLSLFAISFLDTDVAGTQGTTLSAQDVTRALSSAASVTPPSSTPSGPGAAAPDASGPAAPSTSSPLNGSTAAPSSASPLSPTGQPPTSAPSSASTSQAMASAKRRISGHGGQVEAQCQGSLAYLVSWTPAQGFHAGPVQRGPARYAAAVFVDDALQRPWTLHVSCLNGTPTAVSGDDDWNDH